MLKLVLDYIVYIIFIEYVFSLLNCNVYFTLSALKIN